MDWTTVRVVVLVVAWSTPSLALNFGTDNAVRAATFEFHAPGAINGAKGLVGTAFAIGPNRFVTTAHLLDTAVGRPPRVTPLEIRGGESTAADLYFAGWRVNGVITTERGTFSGLTADRASSGVNWLRFSGPVWGAAGGGPVLDEAGRVIGIVQGVSRVFGEPNYAVPIQVLSSEPPNVAQLHGMELLRFLMPTVSSVEPLKADIPPPLAWDEFSREVQQLRRDYYDRMVGPLLALTKTRFVLTGETAADTCSFLNGDECQCKPRAEASGELRMTEPHEEGSAQLIAGVGVVRTQYPMIRASQHLTAALRAPARSNLHLDDSADRPSGGW